MTTLIDHPATATTTATAGSRPPAQSVPPRNSFLTDATTMTRRNLLRLRRTPQIMLFAVVGPVVFVVLFDVVFGGSVATGELDYIDFLIPGVLIQTAVFDGMNTAIALTQDLQRGSLDRFRSLPIRGSAVLIGRTATDLVRATATAFVVVAVGLVLGFRASEGPLAVLAAVALAVAFGHTFNWAYAYFGLKLKDPTIVESAGYLPIFPLVFAASTFAPVENMPGWLRPIAEYQPVTVTADAVRAIMHGGELAGPLTQSVLWIVGLLVLWTTLATRAFAKTVTS